MIKRAIFCGMMAGWMALSGSAIAQDLGPFPVDRERPSPERDLIRDARLTTTSFTFLKLTTQARSAAMGDAYSAVGNDLSAVYYNPAGISQIERWEMVGGYSQWIVGGQTGTFALGAKTNVATFALSAQYFKTEDFEETTSTNPQGTGRMVRSTGTALGLTIAKQVTDKLSVAGTLRWVQQDLDLISYNTVDFNFGTMFYTGFRSTRFAMSLRNLGADREVVAMKARVPTVFNLSGAAEIWGDLGDPLSVTVAVEQSFYTDYVARYYFGTEVWIQNILALRAGYKTMHDSESWSVGAGFKQKISNQTIRLDFSYSRAEAFDEYPIRFTVGLGF